MPQGRSKEYQEVPGGLQGVSEGPRNVSESPKGFQRILEGLRVSGRLRGVLGLLRRFQCPKRAFQGVLCRFGRISRSLIWIQGFQRITWAFQEALGNHAIDRIPLPTNFLGISEGLRGNF